MKQLLTTHDERLKTDDGHQLITISHHEPMAQVSQKPYKVRFIANYSSCTTTELSGLLTSCLTAVKNMLSSTVKRQRSGKNLFWSIKNSGEILDKLKS